jgi:glycine/D-amino acid oxidase-like deaminating enzyme
MPSLDLRFHPWRERPLDAPFRSLWIEEALARDGSLSPPLRSATRSDVCIVGGGFTGLWTALRLREGDPGVSVTVVEADFCGAGASGRNSGATGSWWGKLPALLRLLGPADAQKVLDASSDAVRDIETFVTEHAIDCALRRGPSVWSATAAAQLGAWDKVFEAAEQIGRPAPWRRLEPAQLRELFGTTGPTLAGVILDRAMRLQPAALARGLRARALATGTVIHERSPIERIERRPEGLRVSTAGGGRIDCRQVVLAANAWMAHLPGLRPHITVVSSDMVVTDPIPELLERVGLRHRPDGINSRLMLNYGGTTPDGRVFLGRGGGSVAFRGRVDGRFDASPRQLAQVESDFRHLYPELADVPIARGWSGPVDRSTTGLPWFGSLEGHPDVHYGIGYSGHGVGATALGGRILAARVLGRQDGWTEVAHCLQRARRGRFPPEPLRFVGGMLVKGAVQRKEVAEREGREPGRLDRALARLAPATITESRSQRS